MKKYLENPSGGSRPTPAHESTGPLQRDDWGASSGEIRVYFNVGNAGEAMFAKAHDPGFPPIIEPRTIMADLNEDGDEDAFIPSTLGSCFVERSFLKHGYARGHILRLEKKEEKRRKK